MIPIGAAIPLQYESILFHTFRGLKAIKNMYGMTEVGLISLSMNIGSIGKPVPGTDVKIIDIETGEVQVKGRIGEILVKKAVKILQS